MGLLASLLLGGTAHAGIGFAIGAKSWDIWWSEDNDNRWGFVLFPVNYYLRNIGGVATNLVNLIDSEFEEENAKLVYCIITAVIWPLRVSLLLPSWVIVGALLLLQRWRRRPASEVVPNQI